MSYSTSVPPFNWTGGKGALSPKILNHMWCLFPKGGTLISPFFGAGALEFRWMYRGWLCIGSDVNRALIYAYREIQRVRMLLHLGVIN